jgi:hypothetical protein
MFVQRQWLERPISLLRDFSQHAFSQIFGVVGGHELFPKIHQALGLNYLHPVYFL